MKTLLVVAIVFCLFALLAVAELSYSSIVAVPINDAVLSPVKVDSVVILNKVVVVVPVDGFKYVGNGDYVSASSLFNAAVKKRVVVPVDEPVIEVKG